MVDTRITVSSVDKSTAEMVARSPPHTALFIQYFAEIYGVGLTQKDAIALLNHIMDGSITTKADVMALALIMERF